MNTDPDPMLKWMNETINDLNSQLAAVTAFAEDLIDLVEHTDMCPVSSPKWSGQKCRCSIGPIMERWKQLVNDQQV
jgi:hypothetical protein